MTVSLRPLSTLLILVAWLVSAGPAHAEFRLERTIPLASSGDSGVALPGDVAATDSAVYVGDGSGIAVFAWNGQELGHFSPPGLQTGSLAARADGTLFVIVDGSDLVRISPAGSVAGRWRLLTPDSRSYVRNVATDGRDVSVLVTIAGQTAIRTYNDAGTLVRETALPYPALRFAPGPSGRYFTNIASAAIDLFGQPARIFGAVQPDPPAGSFSGDGPSDYVFNASDRTLIVADYGGARVSAFDSRGRVLDACPAVRSTPATSGPVGLPGAIDVTASGRVAVTNQWSPGVTLLRRVTRTTHPCDRGPAALLTSRLSRSTAATRAQRRSIMLVSRLSKPGVLRVCLRGQRTARCTKIAARGQEVDTNLSRRFQLASARRGSYSVTVRSIATPKTRLRLRLK